MSKPIRQCMTVTGKAKKTFSTFDDAVAWAHKMNKDPKNIWKVRAYKCKYCFKFHTGRDPHNILLQHKINIYE